MLSRPVDFGTYNVTELIHRRKQYTEIIKTTKDGKNLRGYERQGSNITGLLNQVNWFICSVKNTFGWGTA